MFRTICTAAIVSLMSISPWTGTAWSSGTLLNVISSDDGFDNNNHDFDILLDLVIEADLDGALGNPNGDLTLFAPNDGAFFNLLGDLGVYPSTEQQAAEDVIAFLATFDQPGLPTTLETVLTYHVLPQRVSAFTFVIFSIFNIDVTTLAGLTLEPSFPSIVDNEPDLENPRLTFPLNVLVHNGFFHAIDSVLIPVDLP